MAFEEEGFTVGRGPDVLWGGDVRRFHPPAGRFDGVIGGPPCQPFSQLVHMIRANGYEPRHDNLIPEYERVVAEAQPAWWLMEEVPAAPVPNVDGYITRGLLLDNRWIGGEQQRKRRISFGTSAGALLELDVVALERQEWAFAVTGDARNRPVAVGGSGKLKANATGGRTSALNRGGGTLAFEEMCRLQGLPPDFLADAPFTKTAKRQAVGNGVPLPMGRAIARAVKKAVGE
jgi:DNA (cytosine-5)-methyltransferase 1